MRCKSQLWLVLLHNHEILLVITQAWAEHGKTECFCVPCPMRRKDIPQVCIWRWFYLQTNLTSSLMQYTMLEQLYILISFYSTQLQYRFIPHPVGAMDWPIRFEDSSYICDLNFLKFFFQVPLMPPLVRTLHFMHKNTHTSGFEVSCRKMSDINWN